MFTNNTNCCSRATPAEGFQNVDNLPNSATKNKKTQNGKQKAANATGIVLFKDLIGFNVVKTTFYKSNPLLASRGDFGAKSAFLGHSGGIFSRSLPRFQAPITTFYKSNPSLPLNIIFECKKCLKMT